MGGPPAYRFGVPDHQVTVPAPVDPWLRGAADVAVELGGDLVHGLSSEEAAARLQRFGRNRLEAAAPVPEWRKFIGHFADPLIYLLLGAIVVSLVVWLIDGGEGIPFEAIVISVIVIANAVLGYVQEAKAGEAVAALQRMAAATAGVMRDGRPQRIDAEVVVPGDLLLLSEGDAVAADARLVEAASLSISEASLTGESEAVTKDVAVLPGPVGLADRLNMVFDGTAVTRGRGRAIVTATGMTTEMGNIARLLGSTEEVPTPLQREVDHIGRALGMAVLVIAAVVVGAIMLTSDVATTSDVVGVLLVGVSSRSPPCPRACQPSSRWCSPLGWSGWLARKRS